MGNHIANMMRSLRGRVYRLLPVWNRGLFQKKLSGYERRWNLEAEGFTKEGFFKILQRHVLAGIRPGKFWELVAGDGLVGSLGIWLESSGLGWQVEAWEHRELVCRQFRRNRPGTKIHFGRLTHWARNSQGMAPDLVSTRGVREASGLCRAIREIIIRPSWMGIWNPTRRPVWYYRLCREGYRLEATWQNIEFYVDGRRGKEEGGQRMENRARGSGVRSRKRERCE